MSAIGVSATPSYQAQSAQQYGPPQQPNGQQQNFQSLAQAIQSGNLSAAQQAYATLTANAPQQSGTSGSNQGNPFQQALASIGSALQSGDISGAQSALQGMQQAMKSHHGHRHHTANGASGTGDPVSPASTPSGDDDAGAVTPAVQSSSASATSAGLVDVSA